MSNILYGIGFTLIYESVVICNKLYSGSIMNKPLKPLLFNLFYAVSVIVLLMAFIFGFLRFSWWLPAIMLVAVAPILSLSMMKRVHSDSFIIPQAIFF